jgi:hypothetical protein
VKAAGLTGGARSIQDLLFWGFKKVLDICSKVV